MSCSPHIFTKNQITKFHDFVNPSDWLKKLVLSKYISYKFNIRSLGTGCWLDGQDIIHFFRIADEITNCIANTRVIITGVCLVKL